MLKQIKRTSSAIKQRRQGLDHKIQGLFARICLGGRTDMQIQESPGVLNQKRRALTVISLFDSSTD
jgi:hypothetical protein